MQHYKTTAGIGITTDGVEINSYKGKVVNYGKLQYIEILNSGAGYKLPNTEYESIPLVLINGVITDNLISVYASLVSIDIKKIPKNLLTGFKNKPIVKIENHQDDNTGTGIIIDADYTVDGKIIEFNIKDSGKYYTRIPKITIVDSGNLQLQNDIPISAITMTGSIGINKVFTNLELSNKNFNPLSYKSIPINSSIIYAEIPTISLSIGSGATGIINQSNGQISSVTVTSGGSGYLYPPVVRFIDTYGVGAKGHANIIDGKISSVTITNAGNGYSNYTYLQFIENGTGFTAKGQLETWTYNLAKNPYIDNTGGYVYNYGDSFCDESCIPPTVNYPQYLQIINI